MTKTVQELIEQRVSTNRFDAHRELTDAQISELVRLGTKAPSAFNFQNWKFIAVRTPQGKAQLKALAFGQQKVVDAAVTFIVCGTLAPHVSLPAALRPALTGGIFDQSVFDGWVGMANGMYQDHPAFQRDEAVRSASLAAMTLMLAAEGMGLASGPMIGFDADGVSKAFGLSADEIPVMLVTVGYRADGNWPQKPRRDVADLLTYA